MPRRYRVLDVFAERRYEGNPLTVVLDGAGLSTEEMQAIARETNHSETTFVLADRAVDGAWPVRIFTPAMELPFAGHPTLGTAAAIVQDLGASFPVTLDLAAGRIPVTEEAGILWMRQRAPEFLNYAQPAFIARALNLASEDLDHRFPAQTVSTGVPFVVVPVERLARLKKASLTLSRLRELLPRVGAEAVLAFSAETESPEARLHARSFTEAFGIPEDPATGAAAGCLAAWLAEHRYFGSPEVDVVVEQGLEVRRPSRLHLKAKAAAGAFEVRVGGRVVRVAEGTLV